MGIQVVVLYYSAHWSVGIIMQQASRQLMFSKIFLFLLFTFFDKWWNDCMGVWNMGIRQDTPQKCVLQFFQLLSGLPNL